MSSTQSSKRGGRGFFSRIQGKLVLILLILLIPTLLIQVYAFYNGFQKRHAEELKYNLEVARVIAKAFDSFINDVIHQEHAVGLALLPLPPDAQNMILEKSSADFPAASDFSWANQNGMIVAASNRDMIGEKIDDQLYFQALLAGRDWSVSDLLRSKNGEPLFAICRAIRNVRGEVKGVVLARILPDRLHGVLGIDRTRGGGIALIDRQGMLVFRYPFVQMAWEERNWLLRYPEFQNALSGKEVSTVISTPYEEGRRLVGLAPVASIAWIAGAGRSEEVLIEAIASSLLPQAVLFLVVVLSAFGIALDLSHSISTSIARLRNHALDLGSGQLNDFEAATNLAELDDLASAFNRMAADIRSREQERNLAEAELRRSRDELELRVHERTAELGEFVQRLKLATEVAAMGIWEWDVRTRKLIWDDRMFEIFGVSKTDPPTYASATAMIHPEDLSLSKRKLQRDISEKGHSIFEFRIIRPCDGAVRYLQSAAGAIFAGDGKVAKVVGVHFDITERKRVEGELRKIPSRLIAAQEEERKRLAGELHDSIGQTLAALKFRIEHIHLTLKKENVQEAIGLVEQFIPYLQHSIEETRAIYMGLRPKMLEDFGIVATLHWYRDELLKFFPNRHIELDIPLDRDEIPQQLTVPIFRITQEALNNVSKHSKSEWVDISLKKDNGAIELLISDDGVGMDVNYIFETTTARSLGLTSMQERAELTGGRLSIHSTPGEGTTVRAVWPVT